MRTFVLVHGAWHGAWCWERVLPELRARGHRAVAVELPSDDPAADSEEYLRAIDDCVDDPGSTVLVAHSMAGLIAPAYAERRPVGELVLLSCLLPLPGASWREQLSTSRPMAEEFYRDFLPHQLKDDRGRSFWAPEVAADLFYHDCAPEDAAEAASRLRPQAATVLSEETPWRGEVPSPTRYIVCEADRAVRGDWAAQAARARFGAHVSHLHTSHSPFWSRPATLAELLTAEHQGREYAQASEESTQ
ncbi:alpha/beta fold hydrolase [Phaeacidiphilus oryzae]|uniref:alpha/beta fold hydrolase n=1 Tax=Phaeacidiphilus oryzae TaxID=348818 RepID=UPI0006908639|nr:alpha/beta hydrolase [Phaeacidiphilus oryzae]